MTAWTPGAMVVTRTPLRVSLFGGGTDLPEYYLQHGGRVLSLTIDKFVDVVVKCRWDGDIVLGYSGERVAAIDEIGHPITRESLSLVGAEPGLEIASLSDVPAQGSGLGASSAFTVGLLHALLGVAGQRPDPPQLAELACLVELGQLKEPIGKQDQYATAVGGCREYHFHEDGSVTTEQVLLSQGRLDHLASHALMFHTGRTRRASDVLRDQRDRMPTVMPDLHALRDMVRPGSQLLFGGDLAAVGELLHEAWERKKSLSPRISFDGLDDWYRAARDHGAYGGKLLGAGGGGYLFFLAPPDRHDSIRTALAALREMPVTFVSGGSEILELSREAPTDPGHYIRS
jgi:D-glycero-alpha-D-manno-heptose-7-phosphate kinase